MKYYVNSIKSYNNLMEELEAEGFLWINGDNPTAEISEFMKSDLESGGIVICYDEMTEGALTWRGETENKYRGMLFDYSVKIKRKEDVLETLKKLETDNQKYKWNSGERPTEFIPLCDFENENIEILVSEINGIRFRVVKKTVDQNVDHRIEKSPIMTDNKERGKEMKKYYLCETQEEYDWLMKKLEKEGFKWFDGQKPYKKHIFNNYKGNTVIEITEEEKIIYYSNVDYYLTEGGKDPADFILVAELMKEEKREKLPQVVYVVQRLLGGRITTDSVFRTFQAAEKFVLEQGAKPAGYYRYDGGLFEYEIEQMEVEG